ncbi:MAG: LamG domain-containing protein [Candidatus Micrarchaeota archaeon]|nr:LamG domain-containing protein [Candidatus Micrarchaeota archaeon]
MKGGAKVRAERGAKARKYSDKLQLGFEYLLTYGMAFLILGVVVSALFSLHATIFQQRAMAGSCSVFRPSGPYTLDQISLQGVCTNLLPQFVADQGSAYAKFSSLNKGKGAGTLTYPSYLSLPSLPLGGQGSQGFTISAWVYWHGPTAAHCQGIVASNPSPSSGIALFGYGQNNGACGILWINGSYIKWPSNSSNSLPYMEKWQFIVATYNANSGSATVYVNNRSFSSALLSPRDFQTSNATVLGADVWPSGRVYPINGTIANVQIYNAPLGGAEIASMYGEGIGGAPVNLKNLVGWWPLNGNGNDYSGNGNNGVQVNETYASAYVVP